MTDRDAAMHDVFISYATGDKSAADAVCLTLEARSIRCWFAPRDIVPGTNWGGSIIRAIAESQLMVLLFSSRSNQSQQVLREVERAVNKRVVIVPLRIEDVPLSEDMEYFISTPHWLDAFTPPLESHLPQLASTVELLLARSKQRVPGGAQPEATPLAVELGADTFPGEQQPLDDLVTRNQEALRSSPAGRDAHELPHDRQILQEYVFPDDESGLADESGTRRGDLWRTRKLCLQVASDAGTRNICLIAQREVRLGKHRDNDIVLRVVPPTPENDELSLRISRHHAVVEFTEHGALWRNLECANGTVFGQDDLVSAREARNLTHGLSIRPAGVVAIGCDLLDEDPAAGLPRYQDFATRLGAATGDDPRENSICVRLKRTDSLSGLEHYVLFQRGVFLGSNPSCAVLVSHACVAPRHARILHLNDCFWLEPMASVHVDRDGTGEQIPQNRLVRLKPGITLRIGDTEVHVVEYQQHFISPNYSRVE